MGLLTLIGFGLFFLTGIVVGVAVESKHQAEQRRLESIRYWRWARNINCIEQQMANDGWRL